MKNELDFSEQFAVGNEASVERLVTQEDVCDMARISQDYNPIHVDEEYACNHRFGRCIAHGLFGLAMIYKLLGTDLPGKGTVVLSQNIRYRAPIYIGDKVTARVKIEMVNAEKKRLTLSTVCIDQAGQTLVDGTTDVLVLWD